MIFTKEHVERIRTGRKTVTRRIWKRPHVKVGGIYSIRTDRFKPAPADAPRIVVISMTVEPLKYVGNNKALLEGYNSRREFESAWIKLHGVWNPNQEIYVVKFLRVEL